MTNSFAVAFAVARKDLRAEWRTRELVPALAQFVILALVIANFGFQIDSHNAPAIAPAWYPPGSPAPKHSCCCWPRR
jgi:ABC-type transport system involved in cytochrome c biogenesis permease component